MIGFEGDVKLTDFGVAKAAGFLIDKEGEVVAGKADYMSPEQADFQITDKRSDLFSVGVVLGHLLLGKNVFKGVSPEESRDRVMKMAIPDFRKLDKRLDDKLNNILQRTLARDLKQRYATADELLYDLEFYIYNSGYGPTNETLGKFVRELFGLDPAVAKRDAKGTTRLLERPARATRTTARGSRTAVTTRNTKKTIRIH
jgi:serine/threonine-protein kinase